MLAWTAGVTTFETVPCVPCVRRALLGYGAAVFEQRCRKTTRRPLVRVRARARACQSGFCFAVSPECMSLEVCVADVSLEVFVAESRCLVCVVCVAWLSAPPDDIRGIIDKVASVVARNGATFEDNIRAKQQANAKFSFLFPNGEHTGYYR